MADDSKSLLDALLDDSTQAAKKKELHREEPKIPQRSEPAEKPVWPHDPSQLLELSGQDFRTWLAAIDPGDLVCIVAEGDEGLKVRVMASLDDESNEWLKSNLAVWDPATPALREKTWKAVLGAARALVAEGKIALPGSVESDSQNLKSTEKSELDGLTETLIQLVALVHSQGRDALKSVIDDVPHPMLGFGMRCVVEVNDQQKLEAVLEERRRSLEEAYRTELELIRQALLAMARGESPKEFHRKLGKKD